MRPAAFFLPIGSALGEQRFCLFYRSQGDNLRGLVLYIHPFAEEMNKSRRMAALQARAFSQSGYAVLQIDLKGCGDSSGDFGDATWQQWVNDVVQGSRWLRDRHAAYNLPAERLPLWLWGLRAGCLLAVEAARQLDQANHFIFWQAPVSGKILLQQFLRCKVASGMLNGNTSSVMANLRRDLDNGVSLEIAGYMLSPALARGLEQASLIPPCSSAHPQRLVWMDVSSQDDTNLSPASTHILGGWRQAGFETASQLVPGPAFWQASEIEEIPALVAASMASVTTFTHAPIVEPTSA
jgi:exosortase A-associated hydrolase 2